MRASTAAAFAITLGISATYAAPVVPGLDLDSINIGKPSINIGKPSISIKREASPQRGRGRRIGNIIEGIADGAGLVSDGLLINDVLNPQKREASPQRGRGRRIGNIIEGIADGAGLVSDGLLINDVLNPQKREASPQRGRAFVKPLTTSSTCPGYTCGMPPLVDEISRQMRYDFCCS